MKFDHAVKFGGIYYPAGAQIPDPTPEEPENEMPVELEEAEQETQEKPKQETPAKKAEGKEAGKRGRPAKK